MDEESVFARAVRIQSDRERQAFLDDACEGNTQLRAEVEELLRAHAAAGSFLKDLSAGPKSMRGHDSEPEDTVETNTNHICMSFLEPCDKPERIGKLGLYEIIEVVGRGGMGIVLRAWDTKLCRTVAVKVMAPELAASPMAVKRFLSEAQKAAAVVHDHVVTIHAVDDTHRPPFLVMEFIDGQTLQEKIDRDGALQLMPLLRIGAQIADGLATAHQRGLIHRDVKPANILLENGVERVKITDFGLARAADDAKATSSGRVAGTPLYMSPEQARGEPVDQRSDLFSLGAVLYSMCAGRPAFRADSHLAVMRRVCEESPRPIREVNPDIPEWLVSIIDQLLEKDPNRRFQNADEVAELLYRHLAHVQTPADRPLPQALPSPAAGRHARKLAPRSRQWARRSLIGVVTTAVLVGVIVWQFLPKPPYSGAIQCVGNGHWYVVVVSERALTWDEAERESKVMGGHLVTITSADEEDFVVRLINNVRYWSRNPDNALLLGPWIGALQLEGAREPDGGWRWVTGEPFLYSDWETGEPNDGTSPYGPQQHICYHQEEGAERLSAQWGDASGVAMGGPYVKSFIVEFDDLPVPKSHAKADPYTSLFVEAGPVGTNLVVQGSTHQLRKRFLDTRQTSFVAPGTYEWEVLDGSKQNHRLGSGRIKTRAGRRTFKSDAQPPQLLEPGAIQWAKSDGGNGHWYLAVVDPRRVTWDEAKRKAEAMGGHLATITSQAEEDFVVRLVNDDRYWNLKRNGPWIGALKLDGTRKPDGGWRWVTGEDFHYSDWQVYQPNDRETALPRQTQNIRYAATASGWMTAQWGDASLPTRSFVVEWDRLTLPETNQIREGDSYGVLFVPPAAGMPVERAIIFHRNGEFHRRKKFDKPATIFVAPGTYEWQVVDVFSEHEFLRGLIEVKAGERIVFAPDGPAREQQGTGGSETPIEQQTGSATD